jgi:hypothetical protein
MGQPFLSNITLKFMGFEGRLVSHGLRSMASTMLNEYDWEPMNLLQLTQKWFVEGFNNHKGGTTDRVDAEGIHTSPDRDTANIDG